MPFLLILKYPLAVKAIQPKINCMPLLKGQHQKKIKKQIVNTLNKQPIFYQQYSQNTRS